MTIVIQNACCALTCSPERGKRKTSSESSKKTRVSIPSWSGYPGAHRHAKIYTSGAHFNHKLHHGHLLITFLCFCMVSWARYSPFLIKCSFINESQHIEPVLIHTGPAHVTLGIYSFYRIALCRRPSIETNAFLFTLLCQCLCSKSERMDSSDIRMENPSMFHSFPTD